MVKSVQPNQNVSLVLIILKAIPLSHLRLGPALVSLDDSEIRSKNKNNNEIEFYPWI